MTRRELAVRERVGTTRTRCPVTWALVSIAMIAGSLAAQSPRSLLDQLARLDVEDVTIEEAIRALQRASRVAIAFSPDLLPAGLLVTCHCQELTIRRALDRLLAGTDLQYREGRRQILVGRRDSGEAAFRQSLTLTGVVVETGSRQPVAGAYVQLISGARQVTTGRDGRFAMTGLEAGSHRLRVVAIGYKPAITTVTLEHDGGVGIRIELERAPILLADIVITPGSFGILEASPAMGTAITRDDIEAIPQIGDDAFRTLKRLPGVASGDISAKLNVRGSSERDLLVRLDGLELYEPYHLKDVDGALGIVDVQSLGSIDLITGGFTAEYGGKWAGVFDMRTRPPPPVGTRTTLGMSLSSVSFISQGSFAEGRGQWTTSLRRGFLEYVLKVTGVDDDLKPTYWDVLGKTQYLLNDRHLISVEILHAGDGLEWADPNDAGSRLVSGWTNSYAWATWKATVAPRFRAETMLSVGRLHRDRRGGGHNEDDGVFSPLRSEILDLATARFAGIKQDWQLDVTERVLFKAGVDLRSGDAEYDFSSSRQLYDLDPQDRVIIRTDSTAVAVDPAGSEVGAYMAVRAQPFAPLTGEAGLRFDRQSHIGESDLAPRFLLRWDIDPATTLRASWGRYFESQGLHELNVADGERVFGPSERAEQVAAGIEHRFENNVSARIEAYRRVVENPRPVYVNLSREVNPILEVQSDRTRLVPRKGRARGLEILLSQDGLGPLSWRVSYALAAAEHRIASRWVPQTLDQRHTFNVFAAYRLGRSWQFSGSWQYHTGWPFTDQFLDVVITLNDAGEQTGTIIRREFGPLNAERLPAYHRLDVRATRSFEIGRGRLEIYLDVFNAYNQGNIRGYSYNLFNTGGGRRTTLRVPGEEMLPILPTLGFRWVF